MTNEFESLLAASEQSAGDSELQTNAMSATNLLRAEIVGNELQKGDQLELAISCC